MTSPLAPYRVLDLTEGPAQLGGFLLAQLGADVVLVESPGGRERSLTEATYNRGKRSVVLDLKGSEADRVSFRELAAGSDLLITTGGPRELTSAGIDYAALSLVNPQLVHVAISAFGQTGPKADYAATDLVALAAGGLLWLTGDEDRPPVRPSIPQAFANAACDAVGAGLIALWERQHSGLGQQVDVSAQASMLQTTQCMVLAEAIGARPARRRAGGQRLPPLDIQLVWLCKDGLVTVTFMFGGAVGPFTARLMAWVHEEGFVDDDLAAKDWIRFSAQIDAGEEPIEDFDRLKEALQSFLLTKTKAELLDAALRRELVIAPITTIEDVANFEQMASRGYWEDVKTSTGQERHCGAIAKFAATPLPALSRAPDRGAHSGTVTWGRRSPQHG